MAQRRVHLPGIGEIILNKRRGTKNIRLSVTAKGEVRVGMPIWAPYGAGLTFVVKQKKWVKNQLDKHSELILKNGDLIGKTDKLVFVIKPSKHAVADISLRGNTVNVTSQLDFVSPPVQQRVLLAAERSLRRQAEQLLPNRLAALSNQFNLPYKSLKIKKLTGRWGSCSSKNDIVLSIFLVQLPWELIDYVILHELVHTKEKNHGQGFWGLMEQKMPDAKLRRRKMRSHKPRIEPTNT